MANSGRLPLLPGQYGVHMWPCDTLIYLGNFPRAWFFFKKFHREIGIAVYRRDLNNGQATQLIHKNREYPFSKLHV